MSPSLAPHPELLETALQYAERGIPVQPGYHANGAACTCREGVICPNPGKHPRSENGKEVPATCDPDLVRKHWSAWPWAQVKIATGAAAGLLLLDIDRHGDEDGFARLGELEARHGPLPPTWTVRTPRDGEHRYFRLPGGGPPQKATPAPGLELHYGRPVGNNGQAPPSWGLNGKPYQWVEGLSPFDRDAAPAPAWVVALLHAPPKSEGEPGKRAAPLGETIPQGQRRPEILSLAGTLRARGLDADEIFDSLKAVSDRRCSPPCSNESLREIAEDYARKEGGSLSKAPRGEDVPPVVEYLDLQAIARDGIPPLAWLVEPWIVERDVFMLAGGAGIGKSTLLAHMAVAASAGKPWVGIVPARALRVLFFDEEQDAATVGRLFLRLGTPNPNLKVAAGQGIRLDTDEGFARLEREAAEHRPELLLIDSVQQSFGACDPYNAQAVGSVYARLFRLRDVYGATVGLAHHVKKAGQYKVPMIEMVRDSTAHVTQCSAVFVADADGPDSMRVVAVKRRGAPKPSMIVGYREEGDSILLDAREALEKVEGAVMQCSKWALPYLIERAVPVKLADILREAEAVPPPEGPFTKKVVGHAMKLLLDLKSVRKPRNGYYQAKGLSLVEREEVGS